MSDKTEINSMFYGFELGIAYHLSDSEYAAILKRQKGEKR